MDALRRAVLESRGHLDSGTRKAAAEGTLGGELGALAKKIHEEAPAITDEDLATLRRGHTDNALVELIAAAAFGAGDLRLAAAKRALGK